MTCNFNCHIENEGFLEVIGRHGAVNLLFRTPSEDSSLLLVLAHQRIRGFAFMRYINPRLTLTLTCTPKSGNISETMQDKNAANLLL